MQYFRAKPQDLPGIRALLQGSGMPADPSLINHRDIAIVAKDQGQVVGFLWVGLMAKNTKGYIDSFSVSPDYRKRGVGHGMALMALEECKKRGVQEVLGFIARSESHDASAVNALKMAFQTKGPAYTFVSAQIAHIESELKTLRAS